MKKGKRKASSSITIRDNHGLIKNEITENQINVIDELSKQIQLEIDNEFLNMVVGRKLTDDGWYCVAVSSWKDITAEWCKNYIKGQHRCFGHFWYFKDSKDATLFTLKWA
jgi:hypothetical protein